MILAHRADYNGAEESLLLAIGYSTDIYQSCYFELGEVLVQSGRFEDAIEKLSIAIDSMRASGNTWEISSAVFVRAFAYFKLGDFVNALRDLDVAVDGSIYYCGEMWDKFKVLNEVNRAQKSARRF